MPNVAIISGNVNYNLLNQLECCADDVEAVAQLLETTAKYDTIVKLLDQTASEMKDSIRSAVDQHQNLDEIFFYYSGHGYIDDDDFYMCGTDFESIRPNETGLSTDLLHELLRTADAELVVKVIDSCHSGKSLIKSAIQPFAESKGPIKNIIQMASCLDNQTSLTGDPLSLFTKNFIDAAMSKREGIIYYSDITAYLRDQFSSNNRQTPHFISQGTARERFISDAKQLDSLRQNQKKIAVSSDEGQVDVVAGSKSLKERLVERSRDFVSRDDAQKFIDDLLNEIVEKIENDEAITEYYDIKFEFHDQYYDDNSYPFLARILSRETRPDRLVTAEVEQKKKSTPNPFGSAALATALSGFYGTSPDDYYEDFVVSNNSSLLRLQLSLSALPKYRSLQKFTLVVSCAPSMNTCYAFESIVGHQLSDWDKYEEAGVEKKRRWFKIGWGGSNTVATQIVEMFNSIVLSHVEQVAGE